MHDGDPLFPTEAGTRFSDISAINKCLNESYVRSGTKTLYPQKFSATANRRIITTESRNVYLQSAALIAAQLCHSTAMADKTYALQRRKGLSSAAVHLADAAIMQRAEDARVMLKLAVEAMAHEEKDRAQSEKKGREEHHHEEEAELVPEKVVEYLYFDLPRDQSSLYERIKVWLPILDWPAIHADARYWVEESSVQELFSTTCVSLVADSLNEVLGVMFNFNLLSTLRSEIEIPANEERHDYTRGI